jgi:cell division transport system permease protein
MIAWLQPRAQRHRFLPERRLGGGTLPWVIGMMAFLAALALAGGIALSSAGASLTRGIERGFTVQIVEPNPDMKARQARVVVALLEARHDVIDVHMLDDAELKALLEPWLGSGNVGDDLPLPVMVDARFADGARGDPEAIGAAVRRVAPSARVDAHAQWFAPLAGVVDVLTWLAIAIGVLVTAATAAIVALSVRAAISAYTPTIETLHMIGAEDRTIAALFEYRYAISGLIGGAAGVGASLIVVAIIAGLLADFGGGIAATLRLPIVGWLALAMLPLATMALALTTARVAVTRALRAQL